MKLYNFEIQPLSEFLMKLNLRGVQSRHRTRLVRFLFEKMELLDKEHKDLVKEYSNLDDKGEPLVVDIDGVSMYDITDKEKFAIEYNLLMSEAVHIDETVERKEMLLNTRDAVLDTDLEFNGMEALQYDRFCEIFENIYIETE